MQYGRTLEVLKSKLVPGQVYRRSDFASVSSNVDRHLASLVAEGSLKKVSQGLYLAPKDTSFGEAPPDERSLLQSFLKDDRFVVYSPSQFNNLGVGTTQLYNRRVVFNRKRVGEFNLGGLNYTFHRWREAPKELSEEFLVVELLNRLDQLAEDRNQVLARLKEKLSSLNLKKLKFNANHYGTVSSKKKLTALLAKASDE